MLRERGQLTEAERLRAAPLAEMLSAVRIPSDSDETIEQRLAAIFAAEAERVANAAVLADLLAPLLNQHAPSAANAPAASGPASPLPKPTPQPRAAPADIADFIDEMIAQDRPPARHTGQRRAS